MLRSSRSLAVVTALSLVLLPAAARAQNPVRHDNGPFGGAPAPIVPVSIAKVLLDADPKDITLSDSQRVQLTAIQRHLDSTTRTTVALIDSLKPTWRPAGGLNDLSQEQRDELVTKRKAQVALVEEVTPRFTAARERALAVLRPEQRDRANKLEKNARKRAEEFAKREMDQMQNVGMQRGGRRGDIQDATGRSPLD